MSQASTLHSHEAEMPSEFEVLRDWVNEAWDTFDDAVHTPLRPHKPYELIQVEVDVEDLLPKACLFRTEDRVAIMPLHSDGTAEPVLEASVTTLEVDDPGVEPQNKRLGHIAVLLNGYTDALNRGLARADVDYPKT